MHLKSFVVLSIMCLLVFNSGIAQDLSSEKPDKEKKEKVKMNVFKVNLTSLALNNFSFQYERMLSKSVSASLGVRFMPLGKPPLQSTLKSIADGDSAIERIVNDASIGNFALTPELRFYVGRKGYGRGFYVAPFYRYAKFKLNSLPLEYDGNAGKKIVNLSGDITANTGGLLFGAQWFLGKSITLDWWILGAHYGKSNGTFTGIPSTPFTQTEQADIKQEIEDIDLPAGKITAVVTSNSAKAIIDGPWAGLRGGITFGIRF